MPQRNVEAIYPLSPSQQGMLFESLSAAAPGIHIEQSVWSINGGLDVVAFGQAWQCVVERNTILRTAFVWKNLDEPLQVVLYQVDIPLTLHDWRGSSPSEQRERLEVYLQADRHQGFTVASAPLMRLTLLRTGENSCQLVWTFHHILMDGWCLPLILKEVVACYEACRKEQDVPMEPSRPYRDYIAWLKQRDLSRAEAFWRKTLRGITRPTPFGMQVESDSFSGQEDLYGEQKAHLSAPATAALRSLLRRRHLTMNSLMQGVWALLLSLYSGESDVVFGATVSGRPTDLPGVGSIIGLFINTLPVRIKVSPEVPLWSWLEDIQVQQSEQRAYEYCSAGQVHQWSDVPGALPLYESILVFENYPVDTTILQSSGLSIDIQNARFIGAHTRYALTLLVHADPELTFHAIYDRRRFDRLHISWLLEHILVVLTSVIATREQRLATITDCIAADQMLQFRSLQQFEQRALLENFVPPRDALERQLVHIWEEVLKVKPIGVQDSFFDLGGHSLVAIGLMTKIREQFGKDLPLTTLFQGPSVEKLTGILRQKAEGSPWSPLVAMQRDGAARPFFCVSGSGVSVFYLYGLARYLGADQPFYGLEAVGLDGQQAPYSCIEDMAAHNIAAIQTVHPHGPYLLGGHSFGGWVAFEMAQQLQNQGEKVALLAILDIPARVPHRAFANHYGDDAGLLTRMGRLVERFLRKDLEISYDTLQQLDPDEQLHYLKERLIQGNLLPPEARVQQVRGILHVVKATEQAAAQYVPRPIQATRMALFRAHETHPEDARLLSDTPGDPTWGWGQLTTGPVEVYVIPGDHVTMMTEPHVQSLSKYLRTCFAQLRPAALT